MPSFLRIILKFYSIAPTGLKFKLLACLILTLFTGSLELLFLFIVGLFFRDQSIATDLVSEYTLLNSLVENPLYFALLLTLVIALLTISRLITSRLSFLTSADLGTVLSKRCLQSYLYSKPSELIQKVNHDYILDAVTRKVYFAVWCLNFSIIAISSVFTASLIFLFLVLYNFKIFAYLVLPTAFVYLVISLLLKQRVLLNGDKISHSSEKQLEIISNIIKGVREVKIYQLEEKFIDISSRFDSNLRRSQADSNFIASAPRPLVECTAFSIIIFLYSINYQNNEVLSSLAVFILGLQRSLPLLQQFYGSITDIRSYKQSAYEVFSMANGLSNSDLKTVSASNSSLITISKKLNPNNPINYAISCTNVGYSYSSSKVQIVKNFDFVFTSGKFYQFLGTSGSGKSTLLNLLLGFINPTDGKITHYHGSEIIYESTNSINNLHSIPPFFGYSEVSQHPTLFNGTCLENILIEDTTNLDEHKLAKISHALSLDSLLDRNINTLSGGQKQRVALARCLFKNASVYLFDEATNALDPDTEKEIMSFIKSYLSNKLVFFISHNPHNTVYCDKVFSMSRNSTIQAL